MKARSLIIVLFVALLAIFTVGEALAAGQWYWYDVTVPSIGRHTDTYNQTKEATGQASVDSYQIGGDYDLNIRLELVDNTVKSSWYRINDGTFLRYNNTATADQVVHMRLQSDYTDPVSIEANGYWSPDNP